MGDLKKKIETLSPNQKLKLLEKLKSRKLGAYSSSNEVKESQNNKFNAGENFVYKLASPVNFLKTEFVSSEIDDPADDMIQIETMAASLNFRDLMMAMGLYPSTPGVPSVMGSDYAGIVSKVGSKIKNYAKGDKVMVLSGGSLKKDHKTDPNSHFSKYLNVVEESIFPMPNSSSFIDASTIPTVFITSYYALITLANIKREDTVLIHSATGGVGLAAIAICKWIGCKIFATAGNDSKRSLLREMGVELVMDSRTTEFESIIKANTNGRGVDVILNTLSGDKVIAGLNSLNFFGRFLQIDKKDISTNGNLPLGNFNKGLSYYAIDIGLLGRNIEIVRDIITELSVLFDNGNIKAINKTVYPFNELGDALNYMSRSEHIGKIVLDYNL
jgi:NADPH:quinone reductase-like Zn-dependent oxidoreductase